MLSFMFVHSLFHSNDEKDITTDHFHQLPSFILSLANITQQIETDDVSNEGESAVILYVSFLKGGISFFACFDFENS